MLSVTNLTMQYGPHVLFENVNLSFDPNKRYGIVGANGSGKSTLLRLFAGEERPVEGDVLVPKDIRLGVLQQDHFRYEACRVIEAVLQGKPKLWKALEEKEQLLAKDTTDVAIGNRLGELEETIADQDGYNAESFAAELLSGLGIAEEQHWGPMTALSGGFKLRVLLAQVLFQEPDVLLLDEPTNHLDIVSIYWLEQFLKNTFQGTLLLISHDRDFINAVSTYIADVDYDTIQIYKGNFDQFMAAKDLAMEQKLKEIENVEKKIAEKQAFVDRFRYKASKARQAQSRVKQIEKMEIPDVKRSSRVAPHLKFVQKRPSGKEVLNVKEVGKSYGGRQVLKDVDLTVFRGDKLAIIGPNGIGKSTLLKICLDLVNADQGFHQWGHEAHISYFAQDHKSSFAKKINVYDWLYQFAPQETIGRIRGLLGQVLFSKDEVHKSVGALSGGEGARLLFAKIMLEQGNVLIFDEPTNHLDVEGIEALENALRDYEGTLLFVSHDRRFVSNIATRILALTPDGIRDFSGTYDEYLERFGEDYLDREQLRLHAKKQAARSKPVPETLSHEERKELRRKVSQLTKKTAQLEKQIDTQESELAAIDEKFGASDFYATTPSNQIQTLQKNKERLEKNLAGTMKEWEQAAEELEAAKSRLD